MRFKEYIDSQTTIPDDNPYFPLDGGHVFSYLENFALFDAKRTTMFWVRPVDKNDDYFVTYLRNDRSANIPYNRLEQEEADSSSVRKELKHAIANPQQELFLVATRASDHRSLDLWNMVGRPDGPAQGYQASFHFCEGKELPPPTARPLVPPFKATYGPALGCIKLEPFQGDRSGWNRAVKVTLQVAPEGALGSELWNSVSQALISQAISRIKERSNQYTTMVAELGYTENTMEGHPNDMLQLKAAGFNLSGHMQSVVRRLDTAVDVILMQKSLD